MTDAPRPLTPEELAYLRRIFLNDTVAGELFQHIDWQAAQLQAAEITPNAHTLTLKFHRFLSEVEWRQVIEDARKVPFVEELQANAVEDVLRDAPMAEAEEEK